ncbi:hypothetical protein [Sunxiuqinia sp. sy24]|uniref:hypothetical protein n=1 Tax=Sunxiuqinia sp. sy24 TaxID=3461495 RepID=UPI004045DBEF
MISNKHGPPGWMHPPNKGAPRGPSPGLGGQQMFIVLGYFDRIRQGMQERSENEDLSSRWDEAPLWNAVLPVVEFWEDERVRGIEGLYTKARTHEGRKARPEERVVSCESRVSENRNI